MKKTGRVLSIVMVGMLAFGMLTACGSNQGSSGNNKLVINTTTGEGFVQGTEDEAVGKAIEEKFTADTGKELELKVNLYTEGAFNSNIDSMFSSDREQIDGVSHYVVSGGSAVINYARTEDNTIEMSDYIEGTVYQEKIRENDEKHIVERSGYMNINDELKYTVLNDYCNERGWAWAINKSFWKSAYESGKTKLNPDDYDASGADYKNLKVSEFEEVLLAIKDECVEKQLSEMKTPLWAYGWDLLRLFGSVWGVTNLNTVQTNYNGTPYYTVAQLAETYGEFLEWNAHLVQSGIYETANTATNDSTRLDYFISGISAVYMAYPDIEEVIDAGRTLEEYTDWEYMICAPLAKEDGTVTGFTKREKTFKGMIVPWHSQNAQLLMDYINWMYSDRENYDLCKYGRKGIDWVPTTVTVDGITYDAWKYPDGKEEEYLKKPPYSGMYCILENVNVSDRVDASFTERELMYFVRSKYDAGNKGFQSYVDKNAIEGVFVGSVPSTITAGETAVSAGWINGPRSQAWSGMWPEKFASYNEYYDAWRDSLFKEGSKGKGYIDWYDSQVKNSLKFFEEKWGVI